MKELELVELLGYLQRKVMKKIAGSLQEQGLSMTDAIIVKWMFKRGSCRVSEISGFSDMPPSTVTGILDRLVAKGWLERDHDPDDRRAVIMRSTPKLRESMKVSMRTIAKTMERSFRKLPPDLIERLVADLGEVNACLDREEEERA